jgi:hypothetical protein
MAGRLSELLDRLEKVVREIESEGRVNRQTGGPIYRRLTQVEDAIKASKPNFWKTTLGESLKSAVTIIATWGAVVITAKLAADNAYRSSLATTAATKEVETAGTIKRAMTDAVEAFRGSFATITQDPTVSPSADLKPKADSLRNAIYSSLLPSRQNQKVTAVYRVCIESYGRLWSESDPEKRRSIARAALKDIETRQREADDEIQSWFFGNPKK